jgi:molecular chaperone HtpG
MSENEQTKSFEAEVSQLLKMMIHSVYSNQEVFLRELISNASDAIDRLRFAALQDEDLYEGETDLRIRVDFDEDAGTITISDNGVGMSRDEVTENIGTIAKSGTRDFIEQLSGDAKKDAKLIGQFGIGFYSAFMVAERVELETRRAGLDPEEGVRWVSSGEGEYTIASVERPERGTEITIHVTDEAAELLDADRLRQIIRKYSDHISFPIEMPVVVEEDDEDADGWETINSASALWTRRESEVEDDEYREFYKHVAHDFQDPLTWTHSHIEGRLKFSMLFYVPGRRPFDMNTEQEGKRHGIKLYVKRVFIMDDAEVFMPRYLRFVRGVIDSDDLDLNVSREFLQENRVVRAMRKTAVKRVLDMLDELAEDADEYQRFWNEFGVVFKEGVVEDARNQERIAGLLRFSSTQHESEDATVSLDDYLERMKDGQDNIYYVTAESFAAAKNSPHLEVFRDRDVEVLLLHDRVDEWVVSHMTEYDGHALKSVAVGDLDLGDDAEEDGEDEAEETPEELEPLLARVREVLGERVKDVRTTRRLTTSPACLVAGEGGVSANMDRILRSAGQMSPGFQPILELNPEHPIVVRLAEKTDDDNFGDWTEVLFDQALLSEGGKPENPAAFVQRMNKLMVEMMGG